jgi:hypothetical protein
MFLYVAAVAVLLVIGGVEQNPKPDVKGENIVPVLYSGCDGSLNSGTRALVSHEPWKREGSNG